jgi:hypothetical protein
MTPVASLVIVTCPLIETRSLKSIACPLLAPTPVDWMTPALSIENVPAAVALSVVAEIRTASPCDWMVPSELLLSCYYPG